VICKFDNNGNLQWIKNLTTTASGATGPLNEGASALHISSGDTYHAGSVYNPSSSQTRLLISKVSSAGNIVWGRYLGDWQATYTSCTVFACSVRNDGTMYLLYALSPGGFGVLHLSSFDGATGAMTASVIINGLTYGSNPISMSHDGNGGIVVFGVFNPYSQQLWGIRIPDSLNTSGSFTAGTATAQVTNEGAGAVPMSPSPGNQNPYLGFAAGTLTTSVSVDVTTPTSEFVSVSTSVTTTLASNL
jgi:hypothetical protein